MTPGGGTTSFLEFAQDVLTWHYDLVLRIETVRVMELVGRLADMTP